MLKRVFFVGTLALILALLALSSRTDAPRLTTADALPETVEVSAVSELPSPTDLTVKKSRISRAPASASARKGMGNALEIEAIQNPAD